MLRSTAALDQPQDHARPGHAPGTRPPNHPHLDVLLVGLGRQASHVDAARVAGGLLAHRRAAHLGHAADGGLGGGTLALEHLW